MLATVFLIIAMFGGSARPDVGWLLVLRPICLFALAVLLVLPTAGSARSLKFPAILFALLALAIVIQLIPLPPSIWTALPGHERYAEAAIAAGLDQPWHPVSLTPWRTWNSLFALLPASVMLVAFYGVRAKWEPRLVQGFLIFIAASIALGVLQVAGALDGPPLPYRFVDSGSATGFFANRNHAAAALATGFPVLRMWSLGIGAKVQHDRKRMSRRRLVALPFAMILLVMIVVTGSRTGMVVGFVSLGISMAMWPLDEMRGSLRDGQARWARIAVVAVPLVIVILLIFFGKALSVDRIVDDDLMAEQRVVYLPLLLEMTRDFLPLGSGFGSFDPVFRSIEPDWALSLKYFNNAHNDLIELVLTGGIPALLVLLGFLAWMAGRVIASFRRLPPEEAISVRCGAVMAGTLFLASLTDYPLRTPLAGAILVFASYLMASPSKGSTAKVRSA